MMRDFLLSCGYPKERLDSPIKDLVPPPEWHLIRRALDPEWVNDELFDAGIISEVWQTYWVDTGAVVELESGHFGYILIPDQIVVFSGDNKSGWEESCDEVSEIEQSGSDPENCDSMSIDEFCSIPEDDRVCQFRIKDCEAFPQYDLDDPVDVLLDRLIEEEHGSPTWC